jgi:hypothetical protein
MFDPGTMAGILRPGNFAARPLTPAKPLAAGATSFVAGFAAGFAAATALFSAVLLLQRHRHRQELSVLRAATGAAPHGVSVAGQACQPASAASCHSLGVSSSGKAAPLRGEQACCLVLGLGTLNPKPSFWGWGPQRRCDWPLGRSRELPHVQDMRRRSQQQQLCSAAPTVREAA